MTSPTIVSRYANALADIVLRPDAGLSAADATGQLRSFASTASAVPQLQTVLASPAVAPARKRTVIRAIGEKIGVHRLIVNFLLVLSDRRRWSALPEVVAAFEEILDERLGFARADVASAFELAEEQKAELAGFIARLAGKQVRMRLTVDPALIGGVTVRLGSTSYDGSVRGQLSRMRRGLADAQAWAKSI